MIALDPRFHFAALRFLGLEELAAHLPGPTGAAVALLARRVRERLAPESLQCIGTAATMASGGSVTDKRRVVAEVASKLFAVELSPSYVSARRTVSELYSRLVRCSARSSDAGLLIHDGPFQGDP